MSITNADFLEAMFVDLHDGAAAMTCAFAGDPHQAGAGGMVGAPVDVWRPHDGSSDQQQRRCSEQLPARSGVVGMCDAIVGDTTPS